MTTKQFHRLSKSKKKTLVIQDVLAQITAKKYIANVGNYLKPVFSKNINGEEQINQAFDKIHSCQVCGLGSMLLSCTHLGNKLTFSDIKIFEKYYADSEVSLESEAVKNLFLSIFSPKELLLIETAFEGYSFFENSSIKDMKKEKEEFDYNEGCSRYAKDELEEELTFEETFACQKFFKRFKNDENRLKAICNNILKNGTFKP